jgi:hypothetical protein
MKIDIKAGGMKYSVDFRIMPGQRDTHLTAIAKSSKDLDELQTAIVNRGAGDDMIGVIVAKAIEKKLKLPIDVDHSYQGAGYGFKFDTYAIASKLK